MLCRLAHTTAAARIASSRSSVRLATYVDAPGVLRSSWRCFSADALPPIPNEGNVPETIKKHLGANLHLRPNHPIRLIKNTIENYFSTSQKSSNFAIHDSLLPTVTVTSNFDELLFSPTHPGRSPNDTYYYNPTSLLRTHTSAHQSELLRKGERAFLVTGDVYRRDTIDAVHYPVFHQMEGVKLFDRKILDSHKGPSIEKGDRPVDWYYEAAEYKTHPEVQFVEGELKHTLEGLVRTLFGSATQIRWVDAFFPFTSLSWEMEVPYRGEWLEVLGCGVVHPVIMRRALGGGGGGDMERAWAFGLGLERLAMVLFQIPDIRLFWTEDSRFHDQFQASSSLETIKFAPYSKFPPCYKDIAFWIPAGYHENAFYELIRGVAGDLVESVALIDTFAHPKTGRTSHCYRVNYRSMDRNLTNEEIDVIQQSVRDEVVKTLGVGLR